jgi:hypothetical protein
LLKPKGYLKSTTALAGKNYQPKVSPINTKVLVERSTPEENFEPTPSPEEVVPEIKIETNSYNNPNYPNKGISSIPTIVNFVSTTSSPEVKVLVLRNPKENTLYPDSSPVGSPIYTSCKSEETSPRFSFPPLLEFTLPNDRFPYFPSPHLEEVKRSPLLSL